MKGEKIMAKFSLDFTPFQRTDPVTGETQDLLRKGSARQTSPRLKAFQRCVAQQMRGRTFNEGSAEANSRAVREAFSNAARQCEGVSPAQVRERVGAAT
jgi:hypothetical protein